MGVQLVTASFDPAVLLRAFAAQAGDSGAVVTFTGLCRAEGDVEALELDSYPGFTEARIEAVRGEAVRRFALAAATVTHRVGRIAPGEAIVFVAAAARHRRAAFEGADFLMDHLKSRAPFWKKEHRAGGAAWVQPRPQDLEDVSRWD